MAAEAEKQTEVVDEETQPEKKTKKSRKNAKADKEGGEEKQKKRPRHDDKPPIHDQIIEALDVLNERKGVTLPAIKRYLEDNYNVDMTKVASHVRKVLINGVEKGDIIRIRGAGAMGRFKVKHTKPSMIKKRCAPEDYQQLPYTNPKKEKAPAKAKTAAMPAKATTPVKATAEAKANTPKGSKGRSGKRKK